MVLFANVICKIQGLSLNKVDSSQESWSGERLNSDILLTRFFDDGLNFSTAGGGRGGGGGGRGPALNTRLGWEGSTSGALSLASATDDQGSLGWLWCTTG